MSSKQHHEDELFVKRMFMFVLATITTILGFNYPSTADKKKSNHETP